MIRGKPVVIYPASLREFEVSLTPLASLGGNSTYKFQRASLLKFESH